MNPIDDDDKNKVLECSSFNMEALATINNLIQNNEFVKAGMLMNCVCSQISIFKRMCDVCAIQHVIQIEEEDLQKMMDEAVDFVNNFLSAYGITRKFEKMDVKKEAEKIDKIKATLNIVNNSGTKCN